MSFFRTHMFKLNAESWNSQCLKETRLHHMQLLKKTVVKGLRAKAHRHQKNKKLRVEKKYFPRPMNNSARERREVRRKKSLTCWIALTNRYLASLSCHTNALTWSPHGVKKIENEMKNASKRGKSRRKRILSRYLSSCELVSIMQFKIRCQVLLLFLRQYGVPENKKFY